MMPIPPSQCASDLQKRILMGNYSICGFVKPELVVPPKMVAPVVVRPLMVSKTASV